jgi:hypothetical protein
MEPALILSWLDQKVTFDDDEYVALSELNFLFGTEGAKLGRMLVMRATLSGREVLQLRIFFANTQAKLEDPLVVYDHGRGRGTICFQHKRWYELVKNSGVQYQKPTARYVKGEKGMLERIDHVVYARGRNVTAKDSTARPHTLRDVPALTSAIEKLGRVVAAAIAGAAISTSPRETFEYL